MFGTPRPVRELLVTVEILFIGLSAQYYSAIDSKMAITVTEITTIIMTDRINCPLILLKFPHSRYPSIGRTPPKGLKSVCERERSLLSGIINIIILQ